MSNVQYNLEETKETRLIRAVVGRMLWLFTTDKTFIMTSRM